jgi:hypothetical protein
MASKRKTISFTLDTEEYEEILQYARAKGHGGQFPASTFAHYAVFQMMKKYPLSEAEKSKVEGNTTTNARQLQRLYSLTRLRAIKKGFERSKMVLEIKGYKVEVDDEDADRITAYSWWVSSSPETDGHVVCFSAKIGRKIVKLHRFIMGDPDRMVIDHWDGNRLNNRKSNLRACTVCENSMNREMSKRNKSGFRGVHFSKNNQKWRATISLDGKKLHLGYFERVDAAAAAYDRAADLFYGDNRRMETV